MLDQRRFQSSVGYSALLHIGVVMVFFIGLPWLIDAPYQSVPILTVEVVDDVLRTNLDEGLPGKPEDAPQDEVNRQSESNVAPVAASAPPPPPPPDRPDEAESEAVTDDAVALNLDGAAAETPPPQAKPQETAQKAVAPPPAKPAEPRQAPPPPESQDNISSLVQNEQNVSDKTPELGNALQNLLDEAQSVAREDEEEKNDELDEILDDVVRQNVGQAVNVERDDGALGADIITRLRSKIGQCWNPPSAIAGARTLIVDIIVGLDARGEVVSVRAKDAVRYASDEAFKLAAQAAERAFRECSPLIPPLAPEAYEEWKVLQFRFDPRGFLT